MTPVQKSASLLPIALCAYFLASFLFTLLANYFPGPYYDYWVDIAKVEKFFDAQLDKLKELLTSNNLIFDGVEINFSTSNFMYKAIVTIARNKDIDKLLELGDDLRFVFNSEIHFHAGKVFISSNETANLKDALTTAVINVSKFYETLNETEIPEETPETDFALEIEPENNAPENDNN